MANDTTHASGGPDATDDARLDKRVFAEPRRRITHILIGAARKLEVNKQLQAKAGLQPDDRGVEHGTVRILLMNLVGAPEGSAPAFDARLKHTLRQGVVPDDRPTGDDGPRGHRRYLLIDVLQLALVFQIQRALIDPAAAAAFIIDNRAELEDMWLAAARAPDEHWLEIEVDAYAALGGEGKGRPSGRVGALAFAGTRRRREMAEPPPVLRIDLAALRDRVGSSMVILDKAVRLIRDSFPDMDPVDALRKPRRQASRMDEE